MAVPQQLSQIPLCAFLDAQKLRQLSLRSLRIYAYDLLHLARWFKSTRHSLARLNQSLLLDYVRYQLEQQPLPTAQTINHRLCALTLSRSEAARGHTVWRTGGRGELEDNA